MKISPKILSVILIAIAILLLAVFAFWRLGGALTHDRPTPLPEAVSVVAPTPVPMPTSMPQAMASPRLQSELPPPPSPPPVPEGDIRRDPQYRAETLENLRNQRIPQLTAFHAAFFKEAGLNDAQAREFAELLAANELWFFERSVFPGPDNAPPVHPTAEEVTEKRRELIDQITQKFGAGVAGQFRQTYPGPDGGR